MEESTEKVAEARGAESAIQDGGGRDEAKQGAVEELAERLTGIAVVICEALADKEGESPSDKWQRMAAALAEVHERSGCGERPASPDAEKPRRKQLGIFRNPRHIIAWNYKDGLSVECTADMLWNDKLWKCELESAGQTRLKGTIFGGGNIANVIVRHLRNAATSYGVRRGRHSSTVEA